MTPSSKRFLHTPRGSVKNIIVHTYSTDVVLTILISHRKSCD
jgi:hypothetical protein